MTASVLPIGETHDLSSFLTSRLSAGSEPLRADAEGLVALWREGRASAATLADALASFYGLQRTSFDAARQPATATGELSRRYLRDAYIFPCEIDGALVLAVADPGRRDAIRAVRLALGTEAPLAVASYEEIELLFERSAEAANTQAAMPDFDLGNGSAPEAIETLQDLARGAPVVRVLDGVLERAIDLGATDIHFETERDHLRIRLRVDGFLRPDQRLPVNLAPAAISRLKIMANLDIAERRLPQDGRANVKVGSVEADLRVAIMPTMHGETAVVRILTRDTRLLDFTRIGMAERDQSAIRRLLREPNGIIIVTGPTGSGKTTTLATALSILNDPSRKIVTIEDPVEYQVAGVHQTQLKPGIGLTFASALRSFLRHDPDVIMVGEMRDQETAGVGVQAALTGHLVLTTLHTNSAADAVIRLIDLGIEPYLLGASLKGVIGQRLVRRLCERCKQDDPAARDEVMALAKSRGVALDAGARCYSPRGCEACGQSGFRGRIGIFEVIHVGDELRALIRESADTTSLIRAAKAAGTTLMLEDGLVKCADGLTSLDEVLRMTG